MILYTFFLIQGYCFILNLKTAYTSFIKMAEISFNNFIGEIIDM